MGSLFSSNWLPWCTSLFILVSLDILLHIYPHALLITTLDTVRVLPISSMCQNFNLQFTSLLSSLASVLPLMLPLFGIHFRKTFMHHPLLPLLERSQNRSLGKSICSLSHFLLGLLRGTDLFLSLDFEFEYCYGVYVYTTQCRLNPIKVQLKLELKFKKLGSSELPQEGETTQKFLIAAYVKCTSYE